MFERLDADTKAAIAEAHMEARRTGVPEIDTGHLLIVLARHPDTLAGAVLADLAASPEDLHAQLNTDDPLDFDDDDRDALASIGIDLDEVQRRLGHHAAARPASRSDAGRRSRRRGLRFSHEFKSVLEAGFSQAAASKSRKIRREDLLIAIVDNSDSIGAALLAERGIRASDVRQAVATRQQKAS